MIYDRNGKVLARNRPIFSLATVLADIPPERYDDTIKKIAELLRVDIADIQEAFQYAQSRPFTQTLIWKNLSHEQQLEFEARKEEFPGLSIISDAARDYPTSELFATVLGYVGEVTPDDLSGKNVGRYVLGSSIGKAGVELQYEEQLAGKLGKSIIEVAANGKEQKATVIDPAQPGLDLKLTLDWSVQEKLASVLAEGLQEYDSWAGSAVVVDLSDGGVLWMVSLPTYDNNVFSGGTGKVDQVLSDPRSLLVNRAVSGLYAPGSTVKMAIGAMALQKGVITKDTLISGEPQVIRVGGWEFPDWTYSWGRGPHGLMDLPRAIAVSSDIFFYKIGGGYPPECKPLVWYLSETTERGDCQIDGLDVSGVVQALKAFGFGRPTGIDLPNEATGLVPDPSWKQEVRGEPWYLGNTYHLSIGQGDLLASPVQVLNLVNTVATDSPTPQMHIVRAIGGDEIEYSPIEKPVFLEHLQVVRRGMIEAVSEGIIFSLRGAKVSVAAKTGTAEFGSLNAKGEYDTHAWVAGFAPADYPEISFVFMLESGGKSSNAAEVARKFVDWYFDSR